MVCISESIEESFSTDSSSEDDIGPADPQKLSIGGKIEVSRPIIDAFNPRTVSKFDHNARMHGINYDGNDYESQIMKNES